MQARATRELDFRMPVCYRPLFDPNVHSVLLSGGRFSGKTKNTTIYCMIQVMAHPRRDVLIFRAKDNSLSTADYKEVLKIVNSDPVFRRFFVVRKKPLGIHRRDGLGNILFRGGDAVGDDDNRTKGLTTEWPLLMYIISECQEFRTKNAVLQLMDSVDRNLTTKDGKVDPSWKRFVTMNPPQNPLHWINDWAFELRHDPDWTVINTTYQDVIMFLNDVDLKKVRRARMTNPQDYAWRYLGVVGMGDGDVYPLLTAKHRVKRAEEEISNKAFPMALIVGVDGATVHDVTSASVGVLMSDGTMSFSQRDCFRHDPLKDGIIPSYSLCAPGGKMHKWFFGGIDCDGKPYKGLLFRYPEGGREGEKSIPIFMKVDDAASELMVNMRQFFGRYAKVTIVHKSTIVEMCEKVNSAIYERKIRFVDDGGYYDYSGARVQFRKSAFIAFDQMRALKWDRTRTHYDDSIPNDDSDSVTYAVFSYYRYPESMNFGQRFANMME